MMFIIYFYFGKSGWDPTLMFPQSYQGIVGSVVYYIEETSM